MGEVNEYSKSIGLKIFKKKFMGKEKIKLKCKTHFLSFTEYISVL